jgi:hypothetical protein
MRFLFSYKFLTKPGAITKAYRESFKKLLISNFRCYCAIFAISRSVPRNTMSQMTFGRHGLAGAILLILVITAVSST